MTFEQVYGLTNEMAKEILGQEDLVKEDLSNTVDVGAAFLSAVGVENYLKQLNDRIAKVVFVDRKYAGKLPAVIRDSWEFGSVVEKIAWDALPVAGENESWELIDGSSYDPNIFYKPSISAKCWNKAVTFEIDMSITEKQVKTAFTSASQLNGFYSMIENGIANAMTLRLEGLAKGALRGMAAETYYKEYAASAAGTNKTGVTAINLLKVWNDSHSGSEIYSVSAALTNKEFIKFAIAIMNDMIEKMSGYSTLFNVGGKERFTPKDKLGVAMHSLLKTYSDVYLQSETFHNELTALPNAETLSHWQGSGDDDDIAERTKIYCKSPSGNDVTINGVLGIFYDTDGVAVCCEDMRTTTQYNAKAEFINEFHKFDARYLIDTNENCVLFYCDASA